MASEIVAFFGAKPIGVMVALMTLSIINCSVLKVTDELPTTEPPQSWWTKTTSLGGSTKLNKDANNNSFVDELFGIVDGLRKECAAAANYDVMQADGPPTSSKNGRKNSTTSNRRRSLEVEEKNLTPLREWQRKVMIEEVKEKVLRFTGRSNKTEQSASKSSQDFLHPVRIPIAVYKREAIPPLCPIKNDVNLTISFNISDPKPASEDMILSVQSAELKLYKIPLRVNGTNQDDTEDVKWQRTFEKSNLSVSDSVIKTIADQDKNVQITIYKIRNKSKHYELRKLDTRMVPASLRGITTWNVTKAINVWGNDTKKTLNLVIVAEDDAGNKLPTRNVFEMRCGDEFDKPFPLFDETYTPSERRHTGWMNLGTAEIPAKAEAYNALVSTVNRINGETYQAGATPVSLTLDD